MKTEIPKFNEDFSLKIVNRIFKKYWYGLPLLIFIAGLFAFIYLRYTVPTYQATSIIQKSEEVENKIQSAGIEGEALFAKQDNLTKVMNLMRSSTFLDTALKSLNLTTEYYLKGKVVTSELYPNKYFDVVFKKNHKQLLNTPIYLTFLDNNKVRVYNDDIDKPFEIEKSIHNTTTQFETDDFSFVLNLTTELQELDGLTIYLLYKTPDQICRQYKENIVVSPSPSVEEGIEITLFHKNAEKATHVVNSLTNLFLNYYSAQRQEKFINVLSYIDEQLGFWENEVYGREESLDKYKKENNIILDEHLLEDLKENIETVSETLRELNRSEKKLAGILSSFDTEKDPYKLMAKIIGTKIGKDMSSSIDKIQQMLLEKENLQYNYTTNSGKIQNLDYQIKVQINALKEIISTTLQTTKEEKSLIVEKLNTYKSALYGQDDFSKTLEIKKLQRLANVSNIYFERLLENRVSYTILKAGTTSPFIILQYADKDHLPYTPVKSNIFLILAITVLLICLLFMLYKYVTYNIIDSPSDISKYTNVPFLGAIPCYEDMDESQLIIDIDPKSISTEAFRSIRNNLTFINNIEGTKVIATTSTIPGEGKTFVSTNLAGILAYSGKKVIVLDLDMRKPKIHHAFSTSNKKIHNLKGISNILIRECTWQECLHNSRLENLSFITGGSLPPNPAELLLSKAMTDLIAELKQHFDYIVLDNPPIGIVSDAAFSLNIADYPIFVFKEHVSVKPFINNLNELYEKGNTKISYILNASNSKKSGSYKYKYKYSYRGYEYVHQDK